MQESNVSTRINTFSNEPITVKDIFKDNGNWKRYRFYHRNELRDVEVAEVEKMLRCREEDNGCFTCYCSNCKEHHTIFLGCNSRICSHCGKRYTDKWARELSKKMFDVPHRHFVMSIPSQLWPIILENRALWKVEMDAAIRAINSVLRHYTRQNLIAGVIVVFHPFGRNLQFNPHIHVLLTEGGFDRKGQFVNMWFFPARAMRRVWQYELLMGLKTELDDTAENRRLIDSLFKRYDEGFYVWLPKESRIKSKREMSRYVGRYVRHPAIADRRIIGYDGKKVRFWYKDREEVPHTVVMDVDEFIGAIIRHIPDRQFKMIRYYGAYCRKWVRKYRKLTGRSSISQQKLDDFKEERKERMFKCPNCGAVMEILLYQDRGPPNMSQLGELIDDWNVLCPT